MTKKLSAALLPLSYYLYTAGMALAQSDVNPCPSNVPAGQGFNSLCNLSKGSSSFGGLIRNGITAVLVISAVIALFYLVWGGIKWILSGGDKAKVDTARQTIVSAIIGLIVAFLAFFILSVVLGLFGLSFNSLTIPNITNQ